jgi:hypothetical protein
MLGLITILMALTHSDMEAVSILLPIADGLFGPYVSGEAGARSSPT